MLLQQSPVPSAHSTLHVPYKAATRRVNRPNQLKLYRLTHQAKNKQQINILSEQKQGKRKEKIFLTADLLLGL
jgi:hypothetical protein